MTPTELQREIERADRLAWRAMTCRARLDHICSRYARLFTPYASAMFARSERLRAELEKQLSPLGLDYTSWDRGSR